MNNTTLSSDNVKSYATAERLEKALKDASIQHHRRLVCKTVEGRFTAVFIGATCINGDSRHITATGYEDGYNAVLGTGFMMVG
jgi:hypothetical protein